ncbi:GNAT family N-acetyltransferase [Pontibacter sp. HSC-14F20]|uniref:GNAT family N-acetyltransferase n=1 Tax=Pontibacter sp. HSC-14F20 TaxID=2864136 RepID=UPI001C72AB88|nr:GNAT family N-acetyltransferase [Pontibacter sp. HSC-14F20]MBX0332368.1 GNAT family N-acetyltransferase [Pontibacter sp. HSC-14F20]
MKGTYTDTESNTLYPEVEDKIELSAGEDALKILLDENFQVEWNSLYQSCHWATVFQTPNYTNAWYKLYKKQYIPILITSYRGNRVTGILNLCMNLKQLEINGAGSTDAYYHTWLAEEYNKESFIKSALHKVREHFPGYTINLFQLPPHTPLKWLETDEQWRALTVLKSYDRPLVDLTHPELSKLYTKKQFKENRNRLKRLGELTFEHVTCIDILSDMFDEMMDQYDFRKGATLNMLPFRSDPQKKDFLLDLFKLKMLHVSVLKMNDKIVASLIATIGKDRWVHGAGINTHAPTFAAYSPGFTSFIMLAQQLASAGYEMLDLSTGDQPYKQRLANSEDQVYALIIKSKAKSILNVPNSIKKLINESALKIGIDYKSSRTRFRRSKKLMMEKWRLLSQQDFKTWLKEAVRDTLSREKEKIYKINTDNNRILSKSTYVNISQNNIKDLLNFTAGHTLKTRWEFLAEAMCRLEHGEHVFTYTENGTLKACIWVSGATKKKNLYASKLAYPTVGTVLNGLYFQPDYQNRLPMFLEAVCAKIKSNRPEEPIYVITSPTIAAFCAIMSNGVQQEEQKIIFDTAKSL